MAGAIKVFKKETKLMGLKPIRLSMGTHFRIKAKIWFQLNHDLWFNLTVLSVRASTNARCPEPHNLNGHWTCIECLRGLMALYGDEWIMDGWTDGRSDGRRTDGLFVCPSV